MVNFLEIFFEQLEKTTIYHYDQQKTNQFEIYFIQAKNQLLCVDKATDKILSKIPYPISVGIVNDTDFIINNSTNKNLNLFFTQKNLNKGL